MPKPCPDCVHRPGYTLVCVKHEDPPTEYNHELAMASMALVTQEDAARFLAMLDAMDMREL